MSRKKLTSEQCMKLTFSALLLAGVTLFVVLAWR